MNIHGEKIKILFIGTSDFGLPSFYALLRDKYFEITGVVTQPDKPVGRKQQLTSTPIKIEAEKNGISVYQPERIQNIKSKIDPENSGLKSKIGVVIAYGQLIPEDILNMPKFGFINVHGSLLPKYRGAACIQTAILNGDKETGITIIQMNKELDTGPILWQEKIKIQPTDTAGVLFAKLSDLAGKILPSVLKKYIAGEIKPIPQDNTKASYVKQLKKQDGLIDWTKPAEEIERFIRAMHPWPGAFIKISVAGASQSCGTTLQDNIQQMQMLKILKILEVDHVVLKINRRKPGKFFLYSNQLAVQCGRNSLIIRKLQLEGKNEMTAEEFIKGNSWIVN